MQKTVSDLQNTDAERMILASILLDNNVIYELTPILKPDMFFSSQFRLVYESILSMTATQEPIDLATLTQYLKRQGTLEKIGGISAVTAIAGSTFTAANVKHYAGIVADYYKRRQIYAIAAEMADMAGKADDVNTAIANLSQKLSTVALGQNNTVSGMFDTCLKTTNWILGRAEAQCPGIMSGVAPLDIALRGWQRKDLIILAARPSMGKTALSQTFALSAAKRGQKVWLC